MNPLGSDRETFVSGDLAALIVRHLRAPPSPTCLGFIDGAGATRSMGWAELGERATGFAQRCAELGASAGEVIAIAWHHGPEAISAWVGAVIGGFVPTFVPTNDPALAQSLGTRVRLTTGPDTLASWPALPLASDVVSADVALVQRTSGTTGQHRPVAIGQRRLLAQIWGLGRALELSSDDVIASCLPLHHDMGLVSTVLLPLVCGVSCVHLDPLVWRADSGALPRAIAASRATLTWLPPSALARLARHPGKKVADLSSLRQIVCGGEVVPARTLREFAARFLAWGVRPEIIGTGWGMAENVAAITHSPPGRAPTELRVAWSSFAPGCLVEVASDDDDTLTLVSSGVPIDGTQVAVRDDDGNEVVDGVLGALYVRGACQADEVRWHSTGDVGLIHDGEVFVCGRRDELLQADTRWIPPHEVELAAASIAGVRPGRVAAVVDGNGALVVLVESPDARAVDTQQIADAVEHHVRRRPRVVIVAPDSLPKSTSGKLGRRRCAALVGP